MNVDWMKSLTPEERLLLIIRAMVFIDFFAVALVVPLISNYFREAGVDSGMYGFISSLYSLSQLFGGMLLGIISDYSSKKGILLLSFAGSAVSYLFLGISKNVNILLFSRILVGLVKQTMSTSTVIVSSLTASNPNARSQELAYMSALVSTSFVVGPSLGGLLFKRDPRLPAIFASALFVGNIFLCLQAFPDKLPHEKAAAATRHSDRMSGKNTRAIHQSSRLRGRVNNSGKNGIKSEESAEKYLSPSNTREPLSPTTDDEDTQGIEDSEIIVSAAESDINLSPSGSSSSSSSSVSSSSVHERETACSSDYETTSTSNNKNSNNSSNTPFKTSSSTTAMKAMKNYIQQGIAGFQFYSANGLLAVIGLRALILFVQSSMSSRFVLNYYQDRFGIETYQLGFISSLYSVLGVLFDTFMVGPLMTSITSIVARRSQRKNNNNTNNNKNNTNSNTNNNNNNDKSDSRGDDNELVGSNSNDGNNTAAGGGESLAMIFSLSLLAFVYVAESLAPNFPVYIAISLIPGALAGSVLAASSKALFLNNIPSSHLGKVIGLFNVISSGVGVIAPLYGAYMMSRKSKDIVMFLLRLNNNSNYSDLSWQSGDFSPQNVSTPSRSAAASFLLLCLRSLLPYTGIQRVLSSPTKLIPSLSSIGEDNSVTGLDTTTQVEGAAMNMDVAVQNGVVSIKGYMAAAHWAVVTLVAVVLYIRGALYHSSALPPVNAANDAGGGRGGGRDGGFGATMNGNGSAKESKKERKSGLSPPHSSSRSRIQSESHAPESSGDKERRETEETMRAQRRKKEQ